MRKDSKIFLKKLLKYRSEINKDEFTLNYKYFEDIPSIRTAIFDILEDLKINNCLTNQSRVTDLDGNIIFYLTKDGITYFDDKVLSTEKQMVFNVSGGLVNFCSDNGVIEAVQNNQQKNIKNSNKNEDKIEEQKKAASLLYHDIKSIEKYLKDKRSTVNIRYLDNWQNLIESCNSLEEKYIEYIYSIYDEVYNYNYSYEQKQKHGLAFSKEDIPAYDNLQEIFFEDLSVFEVLKNILFESTEDDTEVRKYNPNYECLMNKLKSVKSIE